MADTQEQISGQDRATRLLDVLDLQQIEQNLFLGENETLHKHRLFGGQVVAQAAAAAYRTVDGLQLHSLQGYFLRAGSPERPVLYEVERIRDGRSFTTRRVVAIQNGEAILNMDASFQMQEPGFEHANPVPNVPLPHELEDDVHIARQLTGKDAMLSPLATQERPFEQRSVFQPGTQSSEEDRSWSPTWIRFRDRTPIEDSGLARCLLAYASDIGLVSTASLPHQSEVVRGDIQLASLDHALWIHRDVPINDWLLFHKRTSTAQGSRGLVHAELYSTQGELIASVTQEGLMRAPTD
ncbi:MAG: acyl-CoA thioesterase domain-containing protein [Pseudomonadota bacterium]